MPAEIVSGVPPLILLDEGYEVSFTWEQVFSFLGYRNIIASAIMTRLFSRAFRELSPDAPPDREELALLTAFPGEGILEALELVTRVPTRHPERLVINPLAGPDEAPRVPGGRFYLEIQVGQQRRGYWPSTDLINDRFRDQVERFQEGAGTPREQEQYRRYKEETARHILHLEEDELFTSRPPSSLVSFSRDVPGASAT
ncbi:hypothetical protein [Alkalispirochaeta americana]|uniref:hypothetical protein n=1 Tax=Alkalispirochaeta americana TaxID=159291 RepID=UPI001179E607|nr:hypothetical protein [Alkalispirochaeta americana]